jgi:hypothetical protein
MFDKYWDEDPNIEGLGDEEILKIVEDAFGSSESLSKEETATLMVRLFKENNKRIENNIRIQQSKARTHEKMKNIARGNM